VIDIKSARRAVEAQGLTAISKVEIFLTTGVSSRLTRFLQTRMERHRSVVV
jgi:translation initiation factor 2B subunit (eIF-2B alpha/beta/delta family)